MNDVIVYMSAIGFFISVFPFHVFNYIYISTSETYASVNISLFRLIPLFNVNTIKNSVTKMNVNGKERSMNKDLIIKNTLKIFNNLCITKIVQLSDFGIANENNALIAFAQNSFTQALYAFIRVNGGKTKLRNYTVLNYEHGNITYYAKIVGVINLIVASKIITVLLWEKFNEFKIKKGAKGQSV